MEYLSQKRIVANWKMNGLLADLSELRIVVEMLKGIDLACSVTICPPLTLLSSVAKIIKPLGMELGAQNCHHGEKGAFTGEVSAPMLREAGVGLVLLGHSERRALCGETDSLVRLKATSAHKHRITTVICVGENLEERERGEAEEVVCAQVRHSLPETATAHNTLFAYEPVWAIGSGKTPTPQEISQMHRAIRAEITRSAQPGGFDEDGVILYGGSLTPKNARQILSLDDVDGGLVGGASLQAATFLGVLEGLMFKEVR